MAILLFFWCSKLKNGEKAIRDSVSKNFANNYPSTTTANHLEKAILSETIENTIKNSQHLTPSHHETLPKRKTPKKSVKIKEREVDIITFHKSSPPCFVKL